MGIDTITDLLVIGGGINGVGIASDAAGRGLNVTLCEQSDLASETSSYSSKLIHGGLRYLEQYEFRLVRESLIERKKLQIIAPHLVKPQPFIFPHTQALRPRWMIRLGLYLYDFLGGKQLVPSSKFVNFEKEKYGDLKPEFKDGYSYYDCKVDDSRLVVTVAKKASQNGAKILTRTKFIKATRDGGLWRVKLRNVDGIVDIRARAIVNASGTHVEELLTKNLNLESIYKIRLVKGSHIVTSKMTEKNENAFILQNDDGRVIFVIPYLKEFSLIGTTDVSLDSNPSVLEISEEEIDYLCKAVNSYFIKQISKQDIVSSFAGIRALFDTGETTPSKISRDYALDIQAVNNKAPVISVFGGKLTTYRALSEKVVNNLKPYFPELKEAFIKDSVLPGSDYPNGNKDRFEQNIYDKYSFLDKSFLSRLIEAYGTSLLTILDNVKELSDLGQHFGYNLYGKEVKYLIENEWAVTAEDILWRRTKLGLYLNKDEVYKLEQYLKT